MKPDTSTNVRYRPAPGTGAGTLLLVLVSGATLNAEKPLALFHASFDGNTRGLSEKVIHEDIYRPRGAADPVEIEYENGVVGKAAHFTWENGYPGVAYVNRRNIDPEKGTISVWLKWTRPILINRYYPNIWGVLSKEGTASPVALVSLEDQRLTSISEDKKWHHFVYTWDLDSEERHQYLDGKLLASGSITEPVNPKLLVFGFRMPGAMDELTILGRPLSSDETRRVFDAYKAGNATFAIKPATQTPDFPLSLDTQSRRPETPTGVDWRLKLSVEKNEARESFSLNGYWRLQPTKSMQGAIQPDRWVYIKVPSLWKPQPELFDMELKPTAVLWKPKLEETAPLTDEPNSKPANDETNDMETARYPCAWHEREFLIPPGPAGRQFRLRFPSGAKVVSESWHGLERASDVYVNGNYVGSIRNTNKVLEITDRVSLNESNRVSILNGRPWLGAPGTAGFINAPLLEIISPSDVTLGEPLVIPKVRAGQIAVRLPLKNRTDRTVPIRFEAELIDAITKAKLTIVASEVLQLEPGTQGEKEVVFKAQGLTCWSPETPQLYSIVIRAYDGERTLDATWPVRFGYREVWVEKGEIYLNGKRLSIRGSSHNYLKGYGFLADKIKLQKEVGQNADRTLSPEPAVEPSLNITDEQGWLVFYHLTGGPNALKESIKRVGNHPSIIAWQVFGNGYVSAPHGHPMQVGAIVKPEEMAEQRHYLSAEKMRAQDPTNRLVFFYRLGSGGDFRGIMTTLGWGTPIQTIEEWPAHWAKTKQDPLVPTEMQFVIPRSHELEVWQRGSHQIILAEHHAGYFGDRAYQQLTGPLVDSLIKEGTSTPWFTSPHAYDVMELSFGRALRSWRTYGINGYLFHVEFKTSSTHTLGKLNRHGRTLKKVNSPFLFYIGGPQQNFVEKGHNYTAGESIRKSAIFVNDTFHDVAGQFLWEAKAGGKVIAGGTSEINVNQGQKHFHPIRFTCPEVTVRSRLQISANFDGDEGKLSLEDSFQLTLFPVVAAPKPAGRLALIDSTGETEAVLKKCGLTYQLVNEETIDRGVSSLARYTALIIGKNSYSEAANIFRHWLPLDETVKEGLNIICLEQMSRHVMGLKLENLNSRHAFIRASDSPLLTGLESTDFHDWRGESKLLPAYPPFNKDSDWRAGRDSKHGQRNSFGQLRYWHWSNKGMVSTFAFEKPQRGNFRVLMDGGFDLLYTPLIEFTQGNGRILFSQLDLIDHYGIEPVATELFHRILNEYTHRIERPTAKLVLLGNDTEKTFVQDLGIDFKISDTPEGKVVLLNPMDFTKKEFPDLPKQIAAYLNGGGTLVVSSSCRGINASPVESKSGGAPSLDVPTNKTENDDDADDELFDDEPETKQVNEGDSSWAWMLPIALPAKAEERFSSDVPASSLFSGIGMSEFYWRGKRGFLTIKHKAKTVAASGLIGEVPYGKGRIVFLQFEPADFELPWQQSKALRIYSTLFANLGIKNNLSLKLADISGYGKPEEWLPGYTVPEIKKRPMVEDSKHYESPPLNFDPYQHHVW